MTSAYKIRFGNTVNLQNSRSVNVEKYKELLAELEGNMSGVEVIVDTISVGCMVALFP